MRKQILSLLLCCVMLPGLLPAAAFAEGSTAPADMAGTGTAADPYLISTKAQLEAFRDMINSGQGELCAKLTADIDLEGSETNQWTPIGTSSSGFAGIFDGNGKTISGLYINEGNKKYQGLFSHSIGAKPGTIKNLRVKGRVTGLYYVGGIVGKNWGTVFGCSFEGSVTAVEHYPGGIVGENTGVIQSCMNAATVTGDNYCGGISATNDDKISDCYNIGTVTATGNSGNASGIAAVSSQGTARIVNCYNIGTLKKGKMGQAFGITRDRNDNRGEITNCYYLAADGLSSTDYNSKKGKTEFVDGTVLRLLKRNPSISDGSQWEKCGYLEAARMIVPLLKWQTADAHTCTPGAVLGQCDCGGRINDGTAENPYEIYTAEHLKQFRNKVNGGNTGICGTLMNDIVLSDGTFDKDGSYTKGASTKDTEKWTPINGYAGTFDGQDYTVKGVYVTGERYAGLFGSVRDGTVKNVAVTGYVEGTQYVGGVVGYGSNATVSGCTNHAAVKATYDTSFDTVSDPISGGANAGGIAGCLQTGTISNCANIGGITALCTKSWGECSAGGIVGRAGEGNGPVITITACANLGDVSAFPGANNTKAYVGGMVGEMLYYTSIVDCLNAGELSVTEGDAVTPKSGYIGGIFGSFSPHSITDFLPSTSTSNCYSVGTLTHTGSTPVTIRGIAGNASRYSFTNCYWLEGTTEYAVGGSPYRELNVSARSKTEFADGTVLKQLKSGRTDSPWADECKYVAAAGMTLPVFKGQGDSHGHDFKWKYTDDEHWRECACGVIEKDSAASHKEATGICTEGIKCECGYEMIEAKNEHNWSDWVHSNTTTSHTRKCDNKGCGKTETENCSDGNKDHECDTCEAVVSQCTDNSKDHKCDTCGKPLSDHTGGKATCKEKATCEICGEKYGDFSDHSYETAWSSDGTGHWHKCSVCGDRKDEMPHSFGEWNEIKSATETEKGSIERICSACSFKESEDIPLLAHTHAFGNRWKHDETNHWHECACGERSDNAAHSGGSADCHSNAICEICGGGYGALEAKNHTDLKHFDAKAATETAEGNIEYWYCPNCGKYFADKNGTKEIAKADTATAKLPTAPKQPETPKTGDESSPVLWMTLLVISGGAAILCRRRRTEK